MDHSVGVVIMGGGRGTRLEPLTDRRSKPAVPIGGKYRLVDVPISNALHSGMGRMLLLTQYNSHSLHRHIVNTYKFDHFGKGFIQLLAAQQTPSRDHWFQGTADAVRANISYIDELGSDLVLILAGDHIYRMDYRAMVRTLLDTSADLAIAVQPVPEADVSGFGVLRADADGRIVEFREKPKNAEQRKGFALSEDWLASRGLPGNRPYLASMGIYLFRKRVLMSALDNNLADFGRDIIPSLVETHRVQSHFFTGYWRDIGTIESFFDAHMDLVSEHPPFRFDAVDWPIYTHPRFLPCARVSNSTFQRALLGDGSIVVNSTIEDSIVGIRTHVRGATIRRSLLMGAEPKPPQAGPEAPAVGIGEGTHIEGAIIDLNARIGRNVRIANDAGIVEAEGEGWVIRDRIVVIPKDAVVHDGATIGGRS